MDEAAILRLLHAIEKDIAAGLPPKTVFETILEAVQSLGFDRVRLDLLSQDEKSILPTTSRGSTVTGSADRFP